LISSQVLNAILLLPLLAYMYGIARDKKLMGEFCAGRVALSIYGAIITLVALCVLAQFWFMLHL
jgi:Mn2+/Fe2+ NRAMP family transporter